MQKMAAGLLAGSLSLALVGALAAQEKPYTQAGTAQVPPAPKVAPPPVAPGPPAAPPAGESPGTPPSPETAGPEKPPRPPPEPGTLNSFFNGELPDAIGKSKISLNARLRYEYADQDSGTSAQDLRPSNAFTLRTRFGLTSGELYGFQGMLEGENVAVLGPDSNFNAAGTNPDGAGRTVVADPPTTELNQAWLSWHYKELDLTAKGGRQRIALDNHRFVGDVGWRQNMQTFDAATVTARPLDDLTLFYSYLWEVNRVFGDVDDTLAANRDFQSDSHLINVSYAVSRYGRLVGYTYLLDLENAAGDANSCATFGAYFAGTAAIHERVSLGYRAELAWQTDYADSPLSYEAEYYNLEMSVNVNPVAIGAGYEVLGADNDSSFRTPLATLHMFNGWDDVFLTTPTQGLRDIYPFVQVMLPAEIPVRLIYHFFDSDRGSSDFGQELDVVVSKQFGKHWTGLLKYGYYDGKDAPTPPGAAMDVQKFWAQMEFNY